MYTLKGAPAGEVYEPRFTQHGVLECLFFFVCAVFVCWFILFVCFVFCFVCFVCSVLFICLSFSFLFFSFLFFLFLFFLFLFFLFLFKSIISILFHLLQGFRYAEISGLTYTPTEDDITMWEMHTDVAEEGNLIFSDKLLTKIQHLCQWGQKSNLMSVPTDCPQRCVVCCVLCV